MHTLNTCIIAEISGTIRFIKYKTTCRNSYHNIFLMLQTIDIYVHIAYCQPVTYVPKYFYIYFILVKL